ncbi:MAG: BamA/TamA family outer membrane protein, partial [Litoreibacter sp.]|nr:BamA/TamA family outer membrane protein [Litoreibacter sp.]
IVDVDLEETTTGSLGFGVSFGSEEGVGFNVSFSERNFLGRGQILNFSFDTGSDTQDTSLSFVEPAFLGRDLRFGFDIFYRTTDSDLAEFDTQNLGFGTSLGFPVSENGRLRLSYSLSEDQIKNVSSDLTPIIARDEGKAITSALGYEYSYDTRRTGLNPNAGVLLRFGQEFAGVGGDREFIRTTALASAQTRVAREEVLLRAELEVGGLTMLSGNSRVTERFFLGSRRLRGFDSDGVGPRDLGSANQDALGGNYFAVARFEAEFPLGLPAEY